MSTGLEERPIALIVEDRPKALERRLQLFNERGFHAIGAKTMGEALKEFASTPAIDIVITDINLDEMSSDDQSGIALANEIKRLRADIPIVGYSAQFGEGDLELTPREPFDEVFTKANPKEQLGARIEAWRKLALAYKKKRVAQAKEQLKRIQDKYDITDRDMQILRDFLPGGSLAAGADAAAEPLSADDVLRKARYRLCLINAGTRIGSPHKTAAPVILWLREEAGVTVGELYGHPSIYGEGETEADAIKAVLDLMCGYHEDFLAAPPREEDSAEVKSLHAFLARVFG